MGYIYKITNQITGDFYIGKTKNTMKQRWIEHKHSARKGKKSSHFYNAIQKYKEENFVLEQIEETNDLDDKEKMWIAKLRPHYNITPGGDGGPIMIGEQNPMFGKTHKKESINKMCLAKLGKMSGKQNPMFGKSHNEAALRKMRVAKLGKSQSEEHKRKGALSKLGKKRSIETKEKMRLAALGKPKTEEHKIKLKLAWIERRKIGVSEETRKKMRISRTKFLNTKHGE